MFGLFQNILTVPDFSENSFCYRFFHSKILRMFLIAIWSRFKINCECYVSYRVNFSVKVFSLFLYFFKWKPLKFKRDEIFKLCSKLKCQKLSSFIRNKGKMTLKHNNFGYFSTAS